MKILTYEVDRKIKLGIFSKDEEWVYPITSFGVEYDNMQEVIKGMSESEIQLLEHYTDLSPYSVDGAAKLEEVKILAPIQHPSQDVICLGMNYEAHAEESADFIKEDVTGEQVFAIYFSKRVDRATAHGEGIPSHAGLVEKLDYEAELAVVIGKDAIHVSPAEARNYIFGYTVVNDVSARDVQNRHKQWYFGKSLDGFLPMGPCIVTAGAIPYPPKLRIQSKVNGALRQESSTDQLIFGIDHVISELSQAMTLKAGTIIAMGTPSGVGMGLNPPEFLKVGDEVECIIEGIGSIKNPVIE